MILVKAQVLILAFQSDYNNGIETEAPSCTDLFDINLDTARVRKKPTHLPSQEKMLLQSSTTAQRTSSNDFMFDHGPVRNSKAKERKEYEKKFRFKVSITREKVFLITKTNT